MENKNRKVEDSLEAFYTKCATLNVPASVMPEKQFLRRIFRGYMSPFECFVNRVHTKQEAEHIRNVILAHKMKGITGSTIKNTNINSLPDELRMYLNYQECCERIKANVSSSTKLKEKEVLERVKKNDIQKQIAEKELRNKKSRHDILQALSKKLNEEILKEEQIAEKVNSNQQILDGQNAFEEAKRRVNATVEILKDFNAKGISSTVAKEHCWKEIERNIYNLPNALTYDILCKLLNSKLEDPLFQDPSAKNDSLQEGMLDKFYELKIKLGFQLISTKRGVDELKQKCSAKIQQVETQLEMVLDNSMNYYDADEDDVVGEFVSALVAKLIQEGKMKLLQERTQPLKNQSETSLKVYETLMQNIQNSNQLISDKVKAIQLSIAQAHLINEKFKFSNMKLMRTVNNFKLEKHQQTNRAMLNQTVNGHAEKAMECGVFHEELELFLASSLKGQEKIDIKLEHLLASSSITQLFTRNLAQFVKSIKALHDISQNAQMCIVEVPSSHGYVLNSQLLESLEKHHDANRLEIKGTFDSITRKNVNIKRLFGNIHLIYKFIREQSLKRFIDPKQKYEDKTYPEYEKEYLLYYKMIN